MTEEKEVEEEGRRTKRTKQGGGEGGGGQGGGEGFRPVMVDEGCRDMPHPAWKRPLLSLPLGLPQHIIYGTKALSLKGCPNAHIKCRIIPAT